VGYVKARMELDMDQSILDNWLNGFEANVGHGMWPGQLETALHWMSQWRNEDDI
jgi:hypothetical protein